MELHGLLLVLPVLLVLLVLFVLLERHEAEVVGASQATEYVSLVAVKRFLFSFA